MATVERKPGGATIAKLAADSLMAYRRFVLAAAEGGDVDPEEAMQICLAAGRSLPQLQHDLETCASRVEAQREYHGHDYQAQLKADLEERKSLAPQIEAAWAEVDRVSAIHRELRDRDGALLARQAHLRRQHQKASDTFGQLMRKTASGIGEPFEPINFKLSG